MHFGEWKFPAARSSAVVVVFPIDSALLGCPLGTEIEVGLG